MNKNRSLLKIPASRILALILMDVMAIIGSSFFALYIRFDFKFSEIEAQYLNIYRNILGINILMTLFFFVIWKLYKSVWRYASATELINIVFATSCAVVAQIVLCYATAQRMPTPKQTSL